MATIIVLAKNGKPLSAHHRTKLSSLAWFAGRLPTKELQGKLATIGITDPLASTWMLELADGVTVSAMEIEDDDGEATSATRGANAEKAAKQTKDTKPTAADRIATLNAHKRASKAAKVAGTDPIPAKMTPAEADKVADARMTRKAPPVAAAS